MLNAELKSMNSNLTYVSVLSRCVRAGWRAMMMASSVERLVQGGGEDRLMCYMTSRSKHFMRIGVSANWAVVMKQMEMTSSGLE